MLIRMWMKEIYCYSEYVTVNSMLLDDLIDVIMNLHCRWPYKLLHMSDFYFQFIIYKNSFQFFF